MFPYRVLAIALIFSTAVLASLLLTIFAILMAAKDAFFCNPQQTILKALTSKYKKIELTSYNDESEDDASNLLDNDGIDFEEEEDENIQQEAIPLPRGLKINFITDKMNFSNAANHCKNLYENGKLLIAKNQIEESFIMDYIRQNESFKTCEKFLIGYRSIMDKLFSSLHGSLTYPSNEISSKISDLYLIHDKQCVTLSLKDSLRVHSSSCDSTSPCFICDISESTCSGTSLCYQTVNVLWPPMNFGAANKFCKERLSNSDGLALFAHDEIPANFKNQIFQMSSNQLSANFECMALRAKLSKKYEDFDGNLLSYHSDLIHVDDYKDHCLTINKRRDFNLISESCTNENCFICRIDEEL